MKGLVKFRLCLQGRLQRLKLEMMVMVRGGSGAE